MARKSKRQQAIMRRNLFLGSISVILVAAIVLIVWIVGSGLGIGNNNSSQNSINSTTSQTDSEDNSSLDNTSSENNSSKQPLPSTPEPVQVGSFKADANFTKTILVNIKNPLPKDHNYKENIIVFPNEYKWFSQDAVYRKIDADIWPYLKAMIDACRADIGNDAIGIISAWRDYGTQVTLYDAQVKKWKDKGYSQEDAIKEASSRVAVPGTSEHHTGLAVDFNTTDQSFENTKAFKWLKENAENYGFIMRYEKEKMDITGGIIYEPWHWRFVGINIAKEMNSLGMCYEEYCQYKGIGNYVY